MIPIQEVPGIADVLKEERALLIVVGIAVAFYAIEKAMKIVEGYRKRKSEKDNPSSHAAIYECVQTGRIDSQDELIHNHDTSIKLLDQWAKNLEDKVDSIRSDNRGDHEMIFRKLDEIRRQV